MDRMCWQVRDAGQVLVDRRRVGAVNVVKPLVGQ
jgi:hypothetical protein